MLPSSLIADLLTRLLAHDEAARARLAPHAGESLRFRMPPFELALLVTAEGTLISGVETLRTSEPTASVELPLAALPLLPQGQDVLLRQAKVVGQAALIKDMAEALKSLPMALEAELERWVGPIFAYEAARLVRSLQIAFEHAGRSLHEATRRYIHDEAKLVASREELSRFAADVQRLRLDLDRLERRVTQLGSA